ncbi:MAG: AMP-binding protein [Rhizomicrobium sp.]
MSNRSSQTWLRALKMTSPILQNPSVTLPVVFHQLASQFGGAPAILSDAATISFLSLKERMEFYANWALSQEIGSGDVVCLFAPTSTEYLAIWLGITRVGGVVALINTNLRGAPLEHSIGVVSPLHIIVGRGLFAAFETARDQLSPEICCWTHGEEIAGVPCIDQVSGTSIAQRIVESGPTPTIHDTALYIFTSGTTGLPKAVPISHFRLMQWSYWFAGLLDIRPNDRMYNCLPMYHSAGGVVAICAALVRGGSVVLPERFSASEFWEDIVRWDCTLFQYIGEMCRYLLKSPSGFHEPDHRIRLCCGNGLSGDVWTAFQSRFRIPQILEFYASTEGNVSLYNCDGRPGAIGRVPAYLAHRFSIELVKCDFLTGEPTRGDDGLCVPCVPDETGHAIGRISNRASGPKWTLKSTLTGSLRSGRYCGMCSMLVTLGT